MDSGLFTSGKPHGLAAALSAVLPGLGHLLRGQVRNAAAIFLISGALVGATWAISNTGGTGAAIFLFMLIGLPWWTFQSYGAYLPEPGSLRRTLTVVWNRGHDIRYLGALFLLTAFTDLYIILANPEYALTIFCTKPAGVWGVLAKAQSPTLHTLIGYGFMRHRRWSLLLYLLYAGFGFLNASVNYLCFGYGRIRTVFLFTLILFTAYILLRRQCFEARDTASRGL
ncbi:MAG: hypothetical protein IH803_03180 [Nitrospirae bacterium]|nr:hypothetical protein [Nitrospirota bacterium]